jgi:hypothetical protein
MGNAQKKWSDEELEVGVKLYDDYEYYAEHALKIKPKDKNDPKAVNGLVPFMFNTAQKYLNYVLKKQLKEIGRVRAYVVKGRQQGISTWIEGKYFHLTSMNYAITTFINTHSDEATTTLYRMAQRFLDNLPSDIKPVVSVSNRKELIFSELDSGYRVSTAGSKETGRSNNPDLIHASEYGFWVNPLDHKAGLLQGVHDGANTWVVFESTANGMGNDFQQSYTQAEAGQHGDYIAVFIPWYWQDEYRKKAPADFVLTEKESEYVELYDDYPVFDENGDVTMIQRKIDNDQMYWRRCKVVELGSEAKANQEYPFSAKMAFLYSTKKSHIPAELVLKALRRPQYRSYGAITAGFDPAHLERENDEVDTDPKSKPDRKAFILRQGANVWGLEYPKLKDHDAQVAFCKRKLDIKINGKYFIDRFFIDFGGGGCGIYQCLVKDGYGARVELVNSSRAAEEDKKYENCRAEMTDRILIALKDNNMPLAIDIDKDLEGPFITDMTAEGSFDNNKNKLQIEDKGKVKSRLGISPEAKDALGLTFSKSFVREHVMGGQRQKTANRSTGKFRTVGKKRSNRR